MREDLGSYTCVGLCELGEPRSSDGRGAGLDFGDRPSGAKGRRKLFWAEALHANVAALLGPSAAGLLDLRVTGGRSLVFLDRSVVLIVCLSGLEGRAGLSLCEPGRSGVRELGRE